MNVPFLRASLVFILSILSILFILSEFCFINYGYVVESKAIWDRMNRMDRM